MSSNSSSVPTEFVAAFHAYGLDRDQTAFVLDDFHQVQNPRLMDDDYFEMVLEKYDTLG
jgi:hypothetical protein